MAKYRKKPFNLIKGFYSISQGSVVTCIRCGWILMDDYCKFMTWLVVKEFRKLVSSVGKITGNVSLTVVFLPPCISYMSDDAITLLTLITGLNFQTVVATNVLMSVAFLALKTWGDYFGANINVGGKDSRCVVNLHDIWSNYPSCIRYDTAD